jgi:hypothetical protein
MSDRPARVSHWLAVLREPGWKFFIALPFTLFTVLAPIRDEFLPAEMAEKWKLPSIIKNHFPTLLVAIPWYVWALITAFVLIWLILEGSYRVAAREAREKATLDARLSSLTYARAQLEFIFDESDPRCVKDEFYPYKEKQAKSRRWFVGIKNSSTTKSADDVTIRAHESWFVGNTISEAHRRIDESLKKSPLIFSRATLEPGAVEFIELFGQGPNPKTLQGNVFKIGHDFVLEARARDAQTVLLTLRYEPIEPFATIKEAMTS